MLLPIIAWDNERKRRQLEQDNDESRRLPLYIPEYPLPTTKDSDDGLST